MMSMKRGAKVEGMQVEWREETRVDTEMLTFLENYMLGLGRRDLLTVLASSPNRWWTLAEIAQETGRPPERARSYLQDLARKGLVSVREDSDETRYTLSSDRRLQRTLERVQQRFRFSTSWLHSTICGGTA